MLLRSGVCGVLRENKRESYELARQMEWLIRRSASTDSPRQKIKLQQLAVVRCNYGYGKYCGINGFDSVPLRY